MVKRMLTLAEVSERLNTPEKTIRNWVALRKIECVKLVPGGRLKFKEEEIDAMITRGTVAPMERKPPRRVGGSQAAKVG